jgi:hypothetical protein
MVLSNNEYIAPTQNDAENPDEIKSDICYTPTAPTQSLLPPQPPPSYPTPPPPYTTQPPPLPIYTVAPPIQPGMYSQAHGMYSQAPVFITQMQTPYQGVIFSGTCIPPQTAHIRDYMIWSIINVFLGGCLLGFIVVYLSMQTKKRKQEGNVQGARSMSKITLTCNILITILFFILTAFLIIYYMYVISILNRL